MPLLSVIIPTRNRTRYLIDSLEVILAHTVDSEVIVHDNSDTDDLKHQLAPVVATGRVRYVHVTEPLSVVGNFERALLLAQGDYITFIGDDDAIGPGIEEIAAWAKEQEIDAVVSYRNSFLASYFWPGVRSKYFGDAYSSQLFVNAYTGRAWRIDPRAALRAVAGKLGGGLGELPRAYHGLISKRVVARIHERHGHLFGGVSPDIYSATLIAAHADKVVVVDYPFVIPGASPSSTAGQGAERSDRGALRATEHIARFGPGLKWDEAIPEFYSPHTVWAYSLCKALEQVPELGIRPNYGRLYATCLMYCKGHSSEVGQAMQQLASRQGRLPVAGQFAKGLLTEVQFLVRRVAGKLMHPRAGGSARKIGPNDTISAAYVALARDHDARRVVLDLPTRL